MIELFTPQYQDFSSVIHVDDATCQRAGVRLPRHRASGSNQKSSRRLAHFFVVCRAMKMLHSHVCGAERCAW